MSRLYLLFLFFIFEQSGVAQKLYRGIVVDSSSMMNLQGVHISVKHTSKVTASDVSGVFFIDARPTDTLVFSSIGYVPLELPLLFQEDALFILLSENKLLLQEIVIKSKRLYPNKIENRTKTAPRTMSGLEGVFSPFDYFWKLEREKRKLTRVVEENNKTQTFRQVVTDPDVKEIMKKEYDLTDELYFNLLLRFNQTHSAVHYYTDPDAIMEALHSFFEENRPEK